MAAIETLADLGIFAPGWRAERPPHEVLASQMREGLGTDLEQVATEHPDHVERLVELAVLNAAEFSIPYLALGFAPNPAQKPLGGPIKILRRNLLPGYMRSTCALINFPKCLDDDPNLNNITFFSSDAVKLRTLGDLDDTAVGVPSLIELLRLVRRLERTYLQSHMPGAQEVARRDVLRRQGVLWAGKLTVLRDKSGWQESLPVSLRDAASFLGLAKGDVRKSRLTRTSEA